MIPQKKKNVIHWNYIKNTTIYQSFIEIEWFVDFKKDPEFPSKEVHGLQRDVAPKHLKTRLQACKPSSKSI